MADIAVPVDDTNATYSYALLIVPLEGTALPMNVLYLENGRIKCSLVGTLPAGARVLALET